MVTGIDIVKTQILVAAGADLFGEEINMPQQKILQHWAMPSVSYYNRRSVK